MEKLDKAHIVYTAKEAYTSYEMYRRIVDMRKCLLPQNTRDPAGSRAMASVVATISRSSFLLLWYACNCLLWCVEMLCV